jgi:hypothetical protein
VEEAQDLSTMSNEKSGCEREKKNSQNPKERQNKGALAKTTHTSGRQQRTRQSADSLVEVSKERSASVRQFFSKLLADVA